MSNEGESALTDGQAQLLHVVWLLGQKSSGGPGSTNLQIQEPFQTRKPGRGSSLANVKKIIDSLLAWKPTPLLEVVGKADNKSILYEISGNMVRWSTHATMLFALKQQLDNDGYVSRADFLKLIANKGMKRTNGSSFSSVDYDRALEQMKEFQDPYISEDDKGFLELTKRLRREAKFLTMIVQP
jgi:hypothetical protein